MLQNLPATQETQLRSLGQEDPLEKGMSTHSSILAWRTPFTEDPAGLQSMGLQKLDMTEQLTHTHTHTYTHTLREAIWCNSLFFSFAVSCCCCCCLGFKPCLTLCNPMDCHTPGLPILHYFPEFAQIHVHWVNWHPTVSSSVIPFPYCPQSFPASGSFPMSQLIVPKVLELHKVELLVEFLKQNYLSRIFVNS